MENQEPISIEINKYDADSLNSTLREMSDATGIYEISEIIKSVNNAITGNCVDDAERLQTVVDFNNFMATIAASNEWIDFLYTQINKTLALSANGN